MDQTAAPESGLASTFNALGLAAAMRAFDDAGLISELDRHGPVTSDELAARTHVSPEALQRVLAALEAGGVVTSAAQSPHAGATPQRWSLVGSAEAWHMLVAGHDAVASYLESGCGDRSSSSTSSRAEQYRSMAVLLGELTAPVARSWAPDFAAPGARILELGAGDAPWARALLDIEPEVEVMLVDFAPVIDALQPNLEQRFPDSRLTFVRGDALRIELGREFDVVIVSAVCRLLAADANQRLFERIAGWLRPDGELVVLDAIDTPAARREGLAIYELSLARRGVGGTHPQADFTRWSTEAGFAEPTISRTELPGHSLLRMRLARQSTRGDADNPS